MSSSSEKLPTKQILQIWCSKRQLKPVYEFTSSSEGQAIARSFSCEVWRFFFSGDVTNPWFLFAPPVDHRHRQLHRQRRRPEEEGGCQRGGPRHARLARQQRTRSPASPELRRAEPERLRKAECPAVALPRRWSGAHFAGLRHHWTITCK